MGVSGKLLFGGVSLFGSHASHEQHTGGCWCHSVLYEFKVSFKELKKNNLACGVAIQNVLDVFHN